MRWVLLTLEILLGVLGAVFLPIWGAFPIIILAVAAAFSTLVWSFLAPSNRFFTFVKEGTAKIIVRGDKFEKALIQWEGYTFDYEKSGVKKWKVVEEEEPRHLFGGLRWYGFWPLLDVGFYHLRWWDLQLTEEGREKIQFHEEDLDYVLLKSDVYWAKIENAETKDRIPIDAEFLVTMRVINPYKVIYVAPINWTENAMTRLSALFRSYVAGKKLDELLKAKEDSQAICKELKKKDLIRRILEEEWGIQIEKGGIQLRDVALSPEYQKAAAAQEAEGMKAEGVKRWMETVGDKALEIRMLEALEKTPAGILTVHAVPGLPEFLRGILGRTPESLSPEEIQLVRMVLRERQRRQQGQEGGRSS